MDLDGLREYCLALPHVTEDIKWGDNLVFSVAEKMFCVGNTEPPFTFSFKVDEEEFEDVAAMSGMIPAPYLARAKWVLAEDPECMSLQEFKDRIRTSYNLVINKLPKRIKEGLDNK